MTEWKVRRAPRYPVALEVKELNGNQEPESYIQDISAYGALLETPILMVPEDAITILVCLGEGGEECTLKGVVVWIRSTIYKENRFLIGINFMEPNLQLEEVGEKYFFGQS